MQKVASDDDGAAMVESWNDDRSHKLDIRRNTGDRNSAPFAAIRFQM